MAKHAVLTADKIDHLDVIGALREVLWLGMSTPGKLIADVNNFKQHVARFLQARPKYQSWSQQLVGILPVLDLDQRAKLTSHEIIPQDLNDLTHGLG